MRIGEVAAGADVTIDTVRYYERQRLLARAPRSSGGFRLFPGETIERIQFIKQAQEIGFSLDEIRELLSNEGGVSECRRVRDLLRTKVTELDERMKRLRQFRSTLIRNLAACERELNEHGQAAHCPVVVNIENKGKSRKRTVKGNSR